MAILASMLLLTAINGFDESDVQAQKDLVTLCQKISKQIPDGWSAKVSPTIPGLVISTLAPVAVEYRQFASLNLVKKSKEPVAIRLIAKPFVSPKDFRQLRKENKENRRRRLEFEDKKLSHLFERVTSSYKASRPISPTMYQPITDDEERIVTQYAFLWMRTQPRAFPSYHFKNISFAVEGLENGPRMVVSISDEMGRKQYKEIMQLLDSVLEVYE